MDLFVPVLVGAATNLAGSELPEEDFAGNGAILGLLAKNS